MNIPGQLELLSQHLFEMVQLRRFLFPLAAVSGVLSTSLGPRATLPIVNQQIAPDGYSRL